MVEVTYAAVEVPVKRVKAALLRPVGGIGVAQMPFANQMCLIAHAFEMLRQRLPLQRQSLAGMPLDRASNAVGGRE